MKVALIIPTLNAGGQFIKLLEQIDKQTLSVKKFLVDSDSTDGTDALAGRFGFEVIKVLRSEFHHGATRQFALESLLKKFSADVVIFLTQDVLLHDDETLAELVKIFSEDEMVGVSYGRQLAHENATFEAKFLRAFNYPACSQLRTFEDRKIFGMKTAFNSNSFAAYRVKYLQEVGGFPARVILSEDMFVAAKMLMAGYKIFYNAQAQVYHSHNYTAAEEFHRYFDIGVFHSRESWIRKNFGSAEGTGKKFVIKKFWAILKDNPIKIFPAIFRDAAKFFGYRLGLSQKFLSRSLCEKFSMNKNYWR